MVDNSNASDAETPVLTDEEIKLVKEYREVRSLNSDVPYAFHIAEAKAWKEEQANKKESEPKKQEVSDHEEPVAENVNTPEGKEDWRDNYIEAYGANKEDKECVAQKDENGGLTINDHETTVKMPSPNRVIMTAKDKDGKPMTPPIEKFAKQVAGAQKDGVEIMVLSPNAKPEFKAHFMIACLQGGMKMENAPELDDKFLSQIPAATKEKLLAAQEEAKKKEQEKPKETEQEKPKSREEELQERIAAARAKIEASPDKKKEREEIEQARQQAKEYRTKGVPITDKDKYVQNAKLIKERGNKLYGGR